MNQVAEAIKSTVLVELHPGLYHEVMDTIGFNDEALIVVLIHLIDNKIMGLQFVETSEAHRVLWLRTFVAVNYYQ